MISFAYPDILWLLLVVPVFIGFYILARHERRKRLLKFGKDVREDKIISNVSYYKPTIKICLQSFALVCLIIAFARPWGGVKSQDTTKEGIEVIIAVDASNSMLAPVGDDQNGPSRMRVAKNMLERLINRLHNDRVGLIVYTSQAYTLIPVTNDYVSAKMFLNSIDPSQFNTQGTDISAAIDMATSSYMQDKRVGKALILLTDAEDLEDNDRAVEAAKKAAGKGIQIDVIGIGSGKGANIPYNGSLLIDPSTGQPVVTSLNEELAMKIASSGKGIYVNANNGDAINELCKQLDTIKKSTLKSSLSVVHDELFWIFLTLALIAIIFDILMLDRKIGWLNRISFFSRKK